MYIGRIRGEREETSPGGGVKGGESHGGSSGLAAAMTLAAVRVVNESTRDVYEAAVRKVLSEEL